MNPKLLLAIAWCTYVASLPFKAMADDQGSPNRLVRESLLTIAGAKLFVRDVGQGRPIIVLHRGPDFDHSYLLPELDRLADSHRLIYYDQRGRGRSAAGVRPEDVTLASDITDLDAVRKQFRLGSVILLGHSWGTVLALEYALR
jgi:proline iminopeptidase